MSTTNQQAPAERVTKYHEEAAQLRRDNPGMTHSESLRRMTAKYGEPARQAFMMGKLPN